MDGGPSIQETYYPDLTCFGCGHANERGLHLQSYEVDGAVRASFTPWPEHDNGGGYLNGGIISTLLAVVTEPGEDAMTVDVQLHWDGKPRAAAVALWKRWRPRS